MATKEEIKRFVFDPGRERWSFASGMTENALKADLVMDLKGFPADVVEEAFHAVRRNHHYPTWPASGKFFQAACDIDSQNPRVDTTQVEATQRSVQAHKYAQNFCNGKKWNKWAECAHRNGFVKSLHDFVLKKAFEALRFHKQPNVHDWVDELENKIAHWMAESNSWKAKHPVPQHISDQYSQFFVNLRDKRNTEKTSYGQQD